MGYQRRVHGDVDKHTKQRCQLGTRGQDDKVFSLEIKDECYDDSFSELQVLENPLSSGSQSNKRVADLDHKSNKLEEMSKAIVQNMIGTLDDLIEKLGTFTPTSTGQKRYQARCKICGKESRSDKIRSHVKNYHPSNIRQSDNDYSTQLTKDYPILQNYETKPSISLTSDGREIQVNDENLKKKINRNQYKCKVCTFISESGPKLLQDHILSVHEGIKRFNCDECDYASAKKFRLQEHVKRIHLKLPKIKDQKCSECEYVAAERRDLIRHSKQHHTNEKDFMCERCPYATASKAHLKAHIKSIHDKIKDKQCTKCDKAFSKTWHLNEHFNSVHKVALNLVT